MSYSPINIIKNAIKNNKLSHAYLFYGDKGVDIEKYIFESIKLIVELSGKKVEVNNIEQLNYFDLEIIKPTISDLGKEPVIKKEHVDESINRLFESSLVANSMKILYIKDVDLGNKHSLNRLLKFIEEPVNNLIIFLSTTHFNNVIGTIRSRSQNIYIKHESILTKINEMKKIGKELTPLLANMYTNSNQIENIDLNEFRTTYNELISSFKQGLQNKYWIKEKIGKIWTKQNSNFVLNIMQFFFYQLMINIDKNNPLFPNEDNLINEYKKKNINSFEMLFTIDKVKKNIAKYSIFNLQKINLLNELEQIL
ncbi:MAG: hypothetical protein HDR43_01420 [Mycoplasma sp.]|nr:hypothetical protein [Mycoplasma sp.]